MSDRAAAHFRRRTIRALPLVLVAVVAASCDSPPELEPEVVEKVETCDEIVPIGEELVRRLFEAVEGAPLEMVIGEAPPSEELAALRAIGTQLDERAARLRCDAAVLNAAIVAETDDLESDDPVAQIFLDVVREGVVGTLPTPPPTTTTTTAAPTP